MASPSPFASIARAAMPALAPLFGNTESFTPKDSPYPTSAAIEQGPGAMATGAVPGGIPGVLYNVFTSAGFTPTAIYGILGNAQQESGFNPNAYNSKEGAGGIFQWRFDRLTGGKAHARQLGLQWNDPRAQALWAVEEINRNPALKAKLNAAQTPEEAATIFDREFEKSAGLHTANRQKFARQWAGGQPVPYDIPTEFAQHPEGLLPPQAGIDPAVLSRVDAMVARIQGKEEVPQVTGSPKARFGGSGLGQSEGQGQVQQVEGYAPGDTFDPALGQGLVARAKENARVRRNAGQQSLPRIQIPGRS